MSIFAKLTTDNIEESKDVLGGSFEPKPTGVYDAVIKLAYEGKARNSDAQSITIHADIDGDEFRETLWITNKQGVNYYTSKDEAKKKMPLPGFTTVDDLCLLTTGHPLAEADTEEKVLKLYDFTERKELPKNVLVLVDLIGQPVKLGILREINDKQKKDDSGDYVNTGETRTENTINKVFHSETGRTVSEYRHEVETPEFMTAWKTKNAGKDRNRAKGVSGSGSGSTGTGLPGASAGSGTKPLFGK